MAVLMRAESEAQPRPVRPSRGFHQRAIYRQHLARLSSDDVLEIEPEAGENLRKLKVNVTRAANELHLTIGYGSTPEGTLLVWLEREPD
jgi:hypothetical protein